MHSGAFALLALAIALTGLAVGGAGEATGTGTGTARTVAVPTGPSTAAAVDPVREGTVRPAAHAGAESLAEAADTGGDRPPVQGAPSADEEDRTVPRAPPADAPEPSPAPVGNTPPERAPAEVPGPLLGSAGAPSDAESPGDGDVRSCHPRRHRISPLPPSARGVTPCAVDEAATAPAILAAPLTGSRATPARRSGALAVTLGVFRC
ncbi:hypothetical protein ACFV3R_00010 [Streptomyces sp. NPDC059740]|uniref:hypothetical protein n=1 Tax=Streptomyces sp. NPDC059740 TaxID=3346926 RepID=UPI00366153FE